VLCTNMNYCTAGAKEQQRAGERECSGRRAPPKRHSSSSTILLLLTTVLVMAACWHSGCVGCSAGGASERRSAGSD
jgi:hypothetical protein